MSKINCLFYSFYVKMEIELTLRDNQALENKVAHLTAVCSYFIYIFIEFLKSKSSKMNEKFRLAL